MSDAPPDILIVEDSPEDFIAMQRALRRAGVAVRIHRCQDGEDALDFLFRRGPYRGTDSAPRPVLVLLDLNLPGTDGREVLAEVKGDETLRTVPVVVFSTSASDRDVMECYRLGANAYVCKPVDIDRFMRSMAALAEFWLEMAILPKGDDDE